MVSNPIRTCMACKTKGTKENFIKIVKNKNGTFMIERDKNDSSRALAPCKPADDAVMLDNSVC